MTFLIISASVFLFTMMLVIAFVIGARTLSGDYDWENMPRPEDHKPGPYGFLTPRHPDEHGPYTP